MTRVALALAFVLAPAASGSLTFGVKAGLDAAQQVPPQTAKAPNGIGTVSGTLVVTGTSGRLVWQLTFQRLSGAATRAELRRGKLGRRGPLAATLCAPCSSGAHGALRVTARTVKAIRNGGAYVELATRTNPAGEIRGQLRLLTGA